MQQTIRLRWLSAFFLVGLLIVGVVTVWLRPESSPSLMGRTFGGGEDPFSLLRVETEPINPYDEEEPDPAKVAARFRTLIQLVTSPNVLTTVASDSRIGSMDFLARSSHSEQALRDHLEVTRREDTSLIEVASRGLDPREGAIVVNAVVEAFLREDAQWQDARNRQSIERLEHYRRDLETDIAAKREEVIAIDREMGLITLTPEGPMIDRAQAEEELRDCLRRLRSIRLERAALQAKLDEEAPTDVETTEEDDQAVIRAMQVELEALNRQEALLVEERDRLAEALAHSNRDEIAYEMARADLEQRLELLRMVDDRLERLEFERLGSEPIIVISEAEPR